MTVMSYRPRTKSRLGTSSPDRTYTEYASGLRKAHGQSLEVDTQSTERFVTSGIAVSRDAEVVIIVTADQTIPGDVNATFYKGPKYAGFSTTAVAGAGVTMALYSHSLTQAINWWTEDPSREKRARYLAKIEDWAMQYDEWVASQPAPANDNPYDDAYFDAMNSR
jgi:hypothetical protein